MCKVKAWGCHTLNLLTRRGVQGTQKISRDGREGRGGLVTLANGHVHTLSLDECTIIILIVLRFLFVHLGPD